ncbi:MAG: hypothetical protein A2836_03675 [Candidatus Taylorbacteria bacterium RIFCSPHIGHO2_01_FULL_45_63]|uniref:Response regulatory domain-containing protein n=1 Tax=Candidatus Taylorbacteria bacterium RIFCSPHIGHO2_02_FULL_45_35 TaxID=1802311 RepID=A0A1G2MQX5_9BACT|nr:MAG: hypothetical protein A2836_03675 [Candidatus Taylorbacteria bacterium RIFCSPHIGHO2_01_FULL_45_63]OHA26258.1 MAG: hypothetical protein A3D56_02270 [Candidatus Taylorbacteria bacterium RIFCSPHIGHO2_02_FULL_45_35]OHA32819.1 MAG: hypothetical protein A3A22_02705 [Candidatus Taylorbacteria bacterium RIFCSPLOWO2_01_FULL_45_34b]
MEEKLDKKKCRIFIVDDDDFLLNMYALKFKQEGFDVDTAPSGEAAIAKLKDKPCPDVLILDIVMPTMDGIELLENLRKNNLAGTSIVIMLTNQGQSSEIERAKKMGVAGYIVKASAIPSEVLSEVLKIVKMHKK